MPVAALLSALALIGCTQRTATEVFADVRQQVDERIGQRVVWYQGTPADQAVTERLHDLLSRELTPEDAVAIALLQNRRLQALYESLGVAQADLVRAGLLHNPVLDVDARFHGDGSVGIDASLVQSFVDILFIPARKRVAEAALEESRLRVTAAVVDTAAAVRAAGYQVEAAAHTLELRQHDQSAAEIAWELATRMHTAGNSTDLDLAMQQDQAEQARLETDAALLHLNEARERLNRHMGTWGTQTTWRMAGRLPALPPEDPPMDGVEGRAIARSLHAAAARQAVTVAARRAGVARPFALLDEAAVGVSAERDASDHDWGLGPAVRMPVPIFNTGQPATLAAQAELRRAEDAFYAVAVEIRAAVRLARNRVELARARSAYLDREVVPLRERIVAQTLLQHNAMTVSPFQLIAARRQQIQATIASVAALAGYWAARVEFDQLLAGGCPDPGDQAPVVP